MAGDGASTFSSSTDLYSFENQAEIVLHVEIFRVSPNNERTRVDACLLSSSRTLGFCAARGLGFRARDRHRFVLNSSTSDNMTCIGSVC